MTAQYTASITISFGHRDIRWETFSSDSIGEICEDLDAVIRGAEDDENERLAEAAEDRKNAEGRPVQEHQETSLFDIEGAR